LTAGGRRRSRRRPELGFASLQRQAGVPHPETLRRLSEQGVDPGASNPEQLAERVRSELAEWTKVVKDAGLPLQ